MSTSEVKCSINDIAITSDGEYAVSASGNNDLQVWDIASRTNIRALRGHTACVNAVATIPNTPYVISASDDETLKVWNVVDGKELTTLRGHRNWVMTVAVTSDGQRAISGGLDNHVKVWDLTNGCELFSLHGHTDAIMAMAVAKDRFAISGSTDHSLICWDIQLGKKCFELFGTIGRKLSVVVSGDGKRVFAVCGDPFLEAWNLVTREHLFSLDTRNKITGKSEDFVDIVLTSGDTQMITALADTLKVWDIERQKVICNFIADNTLRACTVTPDGLTILAGDDKGEVYFFSLDD